MSLNLSTRSSASLRNPIVSKFVCMAQTERAAVGLSHASRRMRYSNETKCIAQEIISQSICPIQKLSQLSEISSTTLKKWSSTQHRPRFKQLKVVELTKNENCSPDNIPDNSQLKKSFELRLPFGWVAVFEQDVEGVQKIGIILKRKGVRI